MEEQAEILKLKNTFSGEWGNVKDCIICITKNGQTVLLTRTDFDNLECVMGAKFMAK